MSCKKAMVWFGSALMVIVAMLLDVYKIAVLLAFSTLSVILYGGVPLLFFCGVVGLCRNTLSVTGGLVLFSVCFLGLLTLLILKVLGLGMRVYSSTSGDINQTKNINPRMGSKGVFKNV